jgi:hypothetical protein
MACNRNNSTCSIHRVPFLLVFSVMLVVGLLLWPAAGGRAGGIAPETPDRLLMPAEQVVLNPSKDNTLYQNDLGVLSNGAGEFFFAGNTAAMAVRRGVLAFDLTGQIPAGSVVTEVELQLYMSRSIIGDQPVTLHRLEQDWGEGTSDALGEEGAGDASTPSDATWIHTFYDSLFWNEPGGDFIQTASATTTVGLDSGWYAWTTTVVLVADVQSWVDQPDENFGWLVLGNERDTTTAKRFNTRENSDATTVPRLIVTFIPPRSVYLPLIVLDGP